MHQGEPCQDMFISPETDVWATGAPCETHTFPLCAASSLCLMDGLCLQLMMLLFTLQWHQDPWVQLSEQQRDCWCSHAGRSLSDFQVWVWEVGIRGRRRAAVSTQLQTPCSPVRQQLNVFSLSSSPELCVTVESGWDRLVWLVYWVTAAEAEEPNRTCLLF